MSAPPSSPDGIFDPPSDDSSSNVTSEHAPVTPPTSSESVPGTADSSAQPVAAKPEVATGGVDEATEPQAGAADSRSVDENIEPAKTLESAESGPATTPSPVAEAAADEPVEIEPDVVGPPPLPSRRAEPVPLNVISNLPPPSWPPKIVADLMMRKIITVMESEPIGDLEGKMRKFRFRHLPVVDALKKLVGLISHADLLHAQLGTAPDGLSTTKANQDTLARDIMRRNVVVARIDSPLITACEVMLKEKLACLPVVLEDGTLVGIATMTDFVRLALALLEHSTERDS